MIEIRNLRKVYPSGTEALKGVDLKIRPGETTALVGESGCGKTTLAKILMGLEKATSGEVLIQGRPLESYTPKDKVGLIQLVFQDPNSSLNPRHSVRQILLEPLKIQAQQSEQEMSDLLLEILEAVGFDESILGRYPHMFSGGQKQRLVLARALMLRPKLLICDEPVSALDVSVQAQILNLLKKLQDKFKQSYLFISHDLHVVKWISHSVYVMQSGLIVENGNKQQIFSNPQHAYTRTLLESTPQLGVSLL